MGTEAQGKTIGIVGLGNVGRRIAELCKGLLGMKVLAYDPYLSASEMAARGAEKVELDDLLQRSDYVSINCPLNKETRGMIGARQFALMQPHAYFITTARGFIHDETALAEALRKKQIAGAGLDVWSREPPRRITRCCNSTMCWRARTRRVSPRKRGSTWARSPPSRCSARSTASGRRASSTPKYGRPTPNGSSACSDLRRNSERVVIPGWSQRVGAFAPPDDSLRTRPQMCDCTSGNLEIPGFARCAPRNDGYFCSFGAFRREKIRPPPFQSRQ